MKRNKPNTIHSQRFAEAQKRWAREDQQREERKALKETLERLEEKETRKERLDREYRNLTKESSQENIRINVGEKMNKRPYSLCAPNTGWKINAFENSHQTYMRKWREEISTNKIKGLRYLINHPNSFEGFKQSKAQEECPAYRWIVKNAPHNSFAKSLLRQFNWKGELSEKQWDAAEKASKRSHR